MKILRECVRFIAFGGLGSEKYVEIGSNRIPRLIPRAIILFSLVVVIILEIINSINRYDQGIQEILLPVHILVHNVVKLAVYLVLLGKIEQISELIDYIDMVVQKRLFLSHFIIGEKSLKRV